MPTIPINNININYEQHGKGEDLVLICGFGSNLTVWKKLSKSLSQKYRVLLFDNRGTGQTDSPLPPYSIEMMSQDLASLMDALAIPHAYILGHSMGSAILQQLCIDHPGKVKKGILLNSFTRINATISVQLDTTSKLFVAETPIELILETLLPWLFGSDYLSRTENIQEALTLFLSDPYPQGPTGFAGQLAALKGFNSRNKLKEITTPTLIITGDQDLYTLPSFSEYLHKHIAGSRLETVKGAGHMIPIEKTQGLLKLIANFF